MPQPVLIQPGRRSCEENRLRRAWASAYHRQPANYLRLLLAAFNTPLLVYRQSAERDLASGEPERIAKGIYWLKWEMARYQRERAKLHAAYPRLYPLVS